MRIEWLNNNHDGREVHTLRRLGRKSLESIEQQAELDLIGASGDMTDAEELFLLTVRGVALKLYESRVMTPRGVGLFLLHQNRSLRDFTPLDMCIAGEPELALEAGRCFADTERTFGDGIDDLEERLDRAVDYICHD